VNITKSKQGMPYSSVEAGQVFTRSGKAYLRIKPLRDMAIESQVTAVNLETGGGTSFGDDEVVQVYPRASLDLVPTPA
jgi:hypothetical protein